MGMVRLFYRRNLPHLQKDYRPHFLTFCTYRHFVLPDWARTIALQSCLHEHQWTVELQVAVVMPDHVHLIFTPLVDDARSEVVSLARITQSIKSSSSHLINRERGWSARIWQTESFDRVLRSSESLHEKIAYIIANPVRRGLVSRPKDWPWLWIASGPHQFAPAVTAQAPSKIV
jgi:REP element-mobilizing transposase RayT